MIVDVDDISDDGKFVVGNGTHGGKIRRLDRASALKRRPAMMRKLLACACSGVSSSTVSAA